MNAFSFLKSLNKIETLLENFVDVRFDQYEAYLHRNVFTISPPLLPYLRLDHHPPQGLPDSLRGQDESLLKQIEEERKAYEQELDQAQLLDIADERIQRRLQALSVAETELEAFGFGSSRDTASTYIILSYFDYPH